jgi:hypothetical protein
MDVDQVNSGAVVNSEEVITEAMKIDEVKTEAEKVDDVKNAEEVEEVESMNAFQE